MTRGIDLSIFLNMVGNLAKPLKDAESKVKASTDRMKKSMTLSLKLGGAGLLATGVKAVTTNIISNLTASTREIQRASGDLRSLGMENVQAVIAEGQRLQSTYVGLSTEAFTRAAYDIKSGVSTLTDEGVAAMTASALTVAKATKGIPENMTSLFATSYGIFKKQFAEMSDADWGDMFGAALSASVQRFKTDGAKMQQAIESAGAGATNLGMAMTDQMTILGMLQQQMQAGEAGTALKAFANKAAEADQAFAKLAATGKTPIRIRTIDENGQLRAMPDLLADLRTAYGPTLEAEERLQIQRALGSEEAIKLIDALYGQEEAVRANAEALRDAAREGAAFTENMAAKVDDYDGADWDRFIQQIDVMKQKIGAGLLPAMDKLVPILSRGATAIGNFTSEHPELVAGLGAAIVGVAGLATVAAPLLFTASSLVTTFAALRTGSLVLGAVLRGTSGRVGLVTRGLGGLKGAFLRVAGMRPIRWASMIPRLSWSRFIGRIGWGSLAGRMRWGMLLKPLRWTTRLIPGIGWAVLAGELLWHALVKPMGWDQYLPKIDWSRVFGAFSWDGWLPKINWSEIASAISWPDWVSKVNWADWLSPISWADWIADKLNLKDWVSGFSWTDLIDPFGWGAWVAEKLNLKDWVSGFTWTDLIDPFSWGAWVSERLNLKNWVSGFSWGDLVPAFAWGQWVAEKLNLKDWVSGFEWSDIIGTLDIRSWLNFTWSAVLPGWSWRAIIPDLPDLKGMFSDAGETIDVRLESRAQSAFGHEWAEGLELVEQYRAGLLSLADVKAKLESRAISDGVVFDSFEVNRAQDMLNLLNEIKASDATMPEIRSPETLVEAARVAEELTQQYPALTVAAQETQIAVTAALSSMVAELQGTDFASEGQRLMQSLAGGIRSQIATVTAAARAITNAIRAALPQSATMRVSVTGGGAPVQARARGGRYGPGWLLTGEEGPELKYETEGGFIAHNRALRNMVDMAERARGLARGLGGEDIFKGGVAAAGIGAMASAATAAPMGGMEAFERLASQIGGGKAVTIHQSPTYHIELGEAGSDMEGRLRAILEEHDREMRLEQERLLND